MAVQTYLLLAAEQVELQALVAVELEKDLDQVELELLILEVAAEVPAALEILLANQFQFKLILLR